MLSHQRTPRHVHSCLRFGASTYFLTHSISGLLPQTGRIIRRGAENFQHMSWKLLESPCKLSSPRRKSWKQPNRGALLREFPSQFVMAKKNFRPYGIIHLSPRTHSLIFQKATNHSFTTVYYEKRGERIKARRKFYRPQISSFPINIRRRS
jgi:hypothetical protein